MDINLKVDRPGYPIGSNMDGTIKLINAYLNAFEQLSHPPDSKLNLWCRGSSGAILAGMFALKCKYECRICHVKKEKENSHNGNFQPYNPEGINIIIDDFVAMGHTITKIVEHIENIEPFPVSDPMKRLNLDVLMVLDWEDAHKKVTNKFKHRIGKRI